MVEESRTNGRMHDEFNSTFITLIPKSDFPQTYNDYRPISLCNCIYNIISKIIANQIKPIPYHYMSEEQFSFLDNRRIHDAIGITQEGLHSMHINHLKGMILKIDLAKAFDRTN